MPRRTSRRRSRASSTRKNNDEPGALFIPAGFLLGFGMGFLYNNIPAGMFLGLGVGFTLFAIARMMGK